MCAQIIDARVKQKTGVAADFAGYVLLEGEMALVRTSATGPVWNWKIGPGLFDDLDWSFPLSGAAQKADTSTVFPEGVPGLYIPTEDGTYEGETVDLSVGYVQLIWDGANMSKVEFPINLSGYAKTNDVTKVDGQVDQLTDQLYNSTPISLTFENGNMSPSTGNDSPSTPELRLRSVGKTRADNITVICGADQEAYLFRYDMSENFVDSTIYQTTYINVPINGYFRLLVRFKSNGAITPVQADVQVYEVSEKLAEKKYVDYGIDPVRATIYDDFAIPELAWENGNISPTTGNNTSTNATLRLRTIGLTYARSVSIICGSNQEAMVFRYASNGAYVDSVSYSDNFNGLEVNGQFRVLVRHKDDSPINPTMLGIVVNTFTDKLADRQYVDNSINSKLFDVTDPDSLAWENGGMSLANGNEIDTNADRRLRSIGMIQTPGYISVECGDDQECIIFRYDISGNYIDYIPYAQVHSSVWVAGLSKILIRYKADTEISPGDEDISVSLLDEIYLRKDEIDADMLDVALHKPPMFTTMPFGQYLDVPIADKIQLFEDIFDAYPATVVKESIGFSNDGVHEVFAYTLTPDNYTVTVAITCHVHGDERHNPLGFIGLLNEISRPYAKDAFVKWLKDNVRWIVVPMVSPLAYIANTRLTQGVNLNRNYDYSFEVTPDTNKGTAPYSMQETRNVRDYFTPLRNEIDFHMDCHDATPMYSYSPFHNREWFWLKELKEVTEWLADVNDAKPIRWPYEGIFGCTTAFFNELLGVPSTTPEWYKAFWTDRMRADLDVQIAKAAEQLAAHLCMFANRHVPMQGSAYYKRLSYRGFASEQYGISTWSWTTFHNYLADIPTWTQATESGVQVYTRGSTTRTIMVIGGITNDDKNSAFVVKSMMEIIAEMPSHLHIQRMKNISMVFVPAINQSGGAESGLTSTVNSLLATHEPDYVLVVRGLPNDEEVVDMVAQSSNSSNFTTYTKANNKLMVATPTGIESLFDRYTTVQLNRPVPEAFRYGYVVQKWIEATLNDIASYAKEY